VIEPPLVARRVEPVDGGRECAFPTFQRSEIPLREKKMAKQTEVQTLVSITGQAEEDVVEMLKRHGGDMDAATNALMDSECTFATAARPVLRHADARKSAAGNQMAGVAAIFPRADRR
jgi:hypothetical protein